MAFFVFMLALGAIGSLTLFVAEASESRDLRAQREELSRALKSTREALKKAQGTHDEGLCPNKVIWLTPEEVEAYKLPLWPEGQKAAKKRAKR